MDSTSNVVKTDYKGNNRMGGQVLGEVEPTLPGVPMSPGPDLLI